MQAEFPHGFNLLIDSLTTTGYTHVTILDLGYFLVKLDGSSKYSWKIENFNEMVWRCSDYLVITRDWGNNFTNQLVSILAEGLYNVHTIHWSS